MINSLSNILIDMINENKISKKTICIAGNITEEVLNNYLSQNFNQMKLSDIQYLDEFTMLIGQGLETITLDERLKGILESLIYDYGFNTEQLSKLLNIDLTIINDVLDCKDVNIENKYLLGIKESYLFYALKRKNK